MSIAPESREAHAKLKKDGKLTKIDDAVFAYLCGQAVKMDSRECYDRLQQGSNPLMFETYNAIQQTFTRLTKSGEIVKVGRHSNPTTGSTTGQYMPARCLKPQGELF